MWLLTTRQRPELAADCLAACVKTGMISRGVVYVDGDEDGLYRHFRVPPNWTVHYAKHAGLSAALDWCLAAYPEEPFYGWLADDMQPRTRGWDRALQSAAGTRCFSQAKDCWVYDLNPSAVAYGLEPSAGMCWGGDLVRAAGWWALPGTFQAGTDVAWIRIVQRLRRMRFCHVATVEHLHWRRGKRERDLLDTDMNDSNGHLHTDRDLEVLWEWLASREFPETVQRLRNLCPLERRERRAAVHRRG